MKKFLSILSIMIFPLIANAMPIENGENFKHPELCERPKCPHQVDMKQRLNLTEEQKIQAKNLRLNSQEKIKPLSDELKAKQSKKMLLVSQDGDEKEIQILAEDIKRLKHQIHAIIVQNEREFVQILTPEQKTEFSKMRAEGKREIHNKRFNHWNVPKPMK